MDGTEGSHFKRVLIATDGSENAEKAASYGMYLAKAACAEVHVLYVISTQHAVTTRTVKSWSEGLEEYLKDKGRVAIGNVEKMGEEAGVKVKSVFLKGIPADKILEYARENNIDLIVVGTHGLTGIKKFLIGSIAEKVVRHSRVPVMVIR
ncbi:Universal stress protein [Methanosarcina barkeri 3]|uniref:Universal stress protein n=1 Tax=Methanosarcina barkeri 3 TaxID=1434107 RepID=A0A0E3SKG6_METBA|nr:universal stress protein [Methanosarcina barkeri]AKB80998.1 Universal stress protein [Methanosarcina barkeri 3]